MGPQRSYDLFRVHSLFLARIRFHRQHLGAPSTLHLGKVASNFVISRGSAAQGSGLALKQMSYCKTCPPLCFITLTTDGRAQCRRKRTKATGSTVSSGSEARVRTNMWNLLRDHIAVDFSTTMQNTDNLNAFVGDVIERQILTDDQMPNVGRDVFAGYPGIGMLGQLLPARLDSVKHAVGGVWVVGRYAGPNVDQVFVGAISANNGQRNQESRCEASKRRRASAFTSAIAGRELGPLSMPSCTSFRRSSTV